MYKAHERARNRHQSWWLVMSVVNSVYMLHVLVWHRMYKARERSRSHHRSWWWLVLEVIMTMVVVVVSVVNSVYMLLMVV